MKNTAASRGAHKRVGYCKRVDPGRIGSWFRSFAACGAAQSAGAATTLPCAVRATPGVRRTRRSQNIFTTCSYCAAGIGIGAGGTCEERDFRPRRRRHRVNPDRILQAYYSDPEARAYMKKHMFQHPTGWSSIGERCTRRSCCNGSACEPVATPLSSNALFQAVRESLHAKPDTVALARKAARAWCAALLPCRTFLQTFSKYLRSATRSGACSRES